MSSINSRRPVQTWYWIKPITDSWFWHLIIRLLLQTIQQKQNNAIITTTFFLSHVLFGIQIPVSLNCKTHNRNAAKNCSIMMLKFTAQQARNILFWLIFKPKCTKLPGLIIKAEMNFHFSINKLLSYKLFWSSDNRFFFFLRLVFSFRSEIRLKVLTLTVFSERSFVFTKRWNTSFDSTVSE